MNKKIPIVMLILLFGLQSFLLQTHATETQQQYDYKSAEFKAVASQFMCTCGCGQDHYACDMAGCTNTDAFKADLIEMMNKGMDKDEIREYYVETLGEEILTAPEKKGFSLTAWVLPFVTLGGAGTGVFFLVRRWTRRSGEIQTSNEEMNVKDEVEEEILSSIIDEERKKYF
ncbi:cytochrome c-type biogenesis protein CcmH [Mesobacillus persicus]|uniref:Cytochrome c-type biogenesis protein n=1 Tax=Mesobacillus persicus TaxID=930146 RepID=A0A1H8C230_9BACI|nr:cytochrome c-type biogenesis protein [Mesobacillus persicus]SEM89103.1 cytochrome c-type biogenesis protein CcmH [Mesobacillus persicus]